MRPSIRASRWRRVFGWVCRTAGDADDVAAALEVGLEGVQKLTSAARVVVHDAGELGAVVVRDLPGGVEEVAVGAEVGVGVEPGTTVDEGPDLGGRRGVRERPGDTTRAPGRRRTARGRRGRWSPPVTRAYTAVTSSMSSATPPGGSGRTARQVARRPSNSVPGSARAERGLEPGGHVRPGQRPRRRPRSSTAGPEASRSGRDPRRSRAGRRAEPAGRSRVPCPARPARG